MEAVTQLVQRGREEIGRSVVGQRDLVDQCLLTLLCGGHALIEGVPGTAKTLVVKLFARVLGGQFVRVQCTPDLMPADITGTNVFNLASSAFTLHKGPVFTELLLVDEINRMPPRTQAALLEAMEERQVTIDGVRHALAPAFTVFATQNPVEFEGTYPLPEAQLDRFLLKIKVDYPAAKEELDILARHQAGFDPRQLEDVPIAALPPETLSRARAEVRQVKVEPQLFSYITNIARRTRDWPAVALGASPRAAVNLLLAAKAAAAMDGRDYVIPDDIKSAVLPVLRHRIMIKPEAELEGIDADRALGEILAGVEVPK